MLKIGLVGAGMMGSTHSRAYRQITGARIAAVCDVVEQKAKAIADEWGVPMYSSLEEMLAKESLDAVDICLPTSEHRAAVELSAQHGKHVFCEKPIAPSIEDAEAMIAACKKANVTFMIGHVVRFFPEYAAARRQLDSGRLGKPAVVRTIRSGAMPTWSSWFSDYSRSGGPLIDLAIHDFDYLRWCFGPVERVFSRSLGDGELGLDHTLTLLRFKSGVIAHVEASWGYPQGAPFQKALEIAGSKGLIQFGMDCSYPLVKFVRAKEHAIVPDSPLAKNPYALELEHFADCVLSVATPLTSGEEALASLRVGLAAVESAASGQPVVMKGEDV